MPASWYESINQAFNDTPVRDAIEEENLFEDWQIVSARIVPCNPLVRSMQHSPELYCWPEVNCCTPVIYKFKMKSGFIENHYADDRAVHMLYDVPSNLLGPSGEELQKLKTLQLKKKRKFCRNYFFSPK